MPAALLIRLILVRLLVAAFVLAGLFFGIVLIDYFLGTSVVTVIWQWLARAWQVLLRWLQFAGKVALRWMPGFAKKFVLRRGLSNVWRIVSTGALALLFAWLGGERYEIVLKRAAARKSGLKAFMARLWHAEIVFLPKWLRAGIFIAATVATIYGFVLTQDWAESRNSPTLFGINPWSMLFGFIASFVLTKLPLVGFDHFLAIVFRPLRQRYRRVIRRKGAVYVALNWLMGFRPARRRAELQRKRFMRRWRQEHGIKSYRDVRREKRERAKTGS